MDGILSLPLTRLKGDIENLALNVEINIKFNKIAKDHSTKLEN